MAQAEIPRYVNMFWRVIQFPLTRIIIALLFVGGILFGVQLALPSIRGFFPAGMSVASPLLLAAVVILAAMFAYAVYVRIIERRRVRELAPGRALQGLASGALLGAGLFAATVGALWTAGYYHVTGTNQWLVFLPALGASLQAGFAEEIVIRGILFRIMEDGLGTSISLAITALIFGFLHLGNPNATIVSALAISLEAGILLGAAFVLTRKLWLPIGIHFAWNFTQGGIFGVAVSGHSTSGLLRSELTGPPLFSGGSFGAEASLFAVLICLAAGIWLLVMGRRRGHFLEPFWSRASRHTVLEA